MADILERLQNFFNNNPFKEFYHINKLRPPGALAEDKFMELCIRCSRCIEVCPHDTIKRAEFITNFQIGTPYIDPEEVGCYLCMRCPPVCPTGALNNSLTDPKKIAMGVAQLDENICLNFKYAEDEINGTTDGNALICNTCYNVCPFPDEAIKLKEFILPVILDECIGCGICVERCPTLPKKAMSIIPRGMSDESKVGFHHQKNKFNLGKNNSEAKNADRIEMNKDGFFSPDDILNKKSTMSSGNNEREKIEFKNNFNVDDDESFDDWE